MFSERSLLGTLLKTLFDSLLDSNRSSRMPLSAFEGLNHRGDLLIDSFVHNPFALVRTVKLRASLPCDCQSRSCKFDAAV